MKIEVYPEKCIAVGQCVVLAPNLFDQRDDDGSVVLLNATPNADEWENARRAAEICPAKAIKIIE